MLSFSYVHMKKGKKHVFVMIIQFKLIFFVFFSFLDLIGSFEL